MKIDRTKFTAQYENGVIKSVWVSIEVALDGGLGETAESALDLSKELSDKWYNKNFPGYQVNPEYAHLLSPPGPPPVIQVKPEDREIGLSVKDIMSCEELAVLDSYRLMVKGNEELSAAYVKRRKEIVGDEINGIMAAAEAFREGHFDAHLKKSRSSKK
jgi:hypothetical protein